MKKKTFDCVEMKRASQEKIYSQIKDMTREEQVAFFRKGAEEFERRKNSAKRNRK